MIISLTSRCIDIMRIMATESWIMLCYLLLSLARLQCDQSNYPANTSFTNNNNMCRAPRLSSVPTIAPSWANIFDKLQTSGKQGLIYLCRISFNFQIVKNNLLEKEQDEVF